MSARKNILRLRRGRSVGFALIGVMGFLIAGFVFEPVISSIPIIAPQPDFEIPFVEDPIANEQFENEMIPEGIEFTEPIMDVPEDAPEPVEPEVPNEPVTSDDSPVDQIADEVIDEPIGSIQICPPICGSDNISIIVEVTKIDSQGNSTIVTEAFGITSLAFLIEEETDVDFENGFLEVRIRAIANDPQFIITGSGSFDLLINNQTIFIDNIPIQVAGESGLDGVKFNFISNIGGQSELFTFSFANNLDKFPDNQISTLEMKIKNLELLLDNRDSFGTTELNIFTMNINKDPNRIIITDEQGQTQRIFPIDDKLTISSLNTKTGSCAKKVGSYGYPRPPMGSVFIFDSEGKLIAEGNAVTAGSVQNQAFCGYTLATPSIVIIDELIQRDSEYRVKISSPTDADFTFKTPKSQKNYSFFCTQNALFGDGTITCNFPKSGEFVG